MARDVRSAPRRRSLGGLRTALAVLLSITIASGLLSGFASLRRSRLVDDVLAGEVVDVPALDAADSFVAATAALDLLLYLATGIVFMIWFWRLAKNASLLDPITAPGAGWAIGSWLVPIGNLWLPAKYLLRSDRPSSRLVDRDGAGARRVVLWWAVVFDVAAVASAGLWRAVPAQLVDRADVEALARADRYDILTQAAFGIAAVLAIFLVRRLTSRQDAAFGDAEEADRADAARRAAFVPPPGFSAPVEAGESGLVARPALPAEPTGLDQPEHRGPG